VGRNKRYKYRRLDKRAMKKLSKGVAVFFQKQPYTVVTTIDKKGCPHNACKGIIDIDANGRLYLLDLYREKTSNNLKQNPYISITAVDEHKFIGYSLKGIARVARKKDLTPHLKKAWEQKITKRISHRLLKNIRGEKGHPSHPEALLPKPEYLIEVDVKEVIDLTPHHIRRKTGV